jgi:23S rRNA pseudoU1915 N3-methylase RlmH
LRFSCIPLIVVVSIIDKEHNDSINEQLKRFEKLNQKLEVPELQKEMNNNLDKLRKQNRLIHSDILKEAIDKMELLIIDEDLTNALGYKMYIEHLISLVQHL